MAIASQSSDFRLVDVRGGLGAVPDVCCSGVASGIKPRKRDLALIDFGGERVCASVITTNDVKAALDNGADPRIFDIVLQ